MRTTVPCWLQSSRGRVVPEGDEHVTYVSSETFDDLLAWLDEPPKVIPALTIKGSPVILRITT